MGTIRLVISLLLLPELSSSKSCTPPTGCAYCNEWDYHGDKVLFQASCNYPTLTSIPNTFPSTLGKLLASHNRITNLTRSSFAGYPYLKDLTLESNFMKNIENGTFLRQALLVHLYLGYNNLQSITAETFQGLRDLQRLRLTRNFITCIPRGVFANLHSLLVLEIDDNKISTIKKGAFEGLRFLRTLRLGGNLLTKFSANTLGPSLPMLTFVDLSFSSIEEISDGSFLELPSLATLHINNCKLRKIPRNVAFKGLRKLTELDMSTNPLSYVSSDAFRDSIKLQSLNMTNMSISVLHNGTFNNLISLKILSISHNPLLCDCSLKWMSEWLDGYNNNTSLHLEFASTTKCSSPGGLAGQRFDHINQTEFQCTCNACLTNSECMVSNKSRNANDSCKCSSDWKGGTCEDVCSNTQKRDRTCSSVEGVCYCSYETNENATIVCHKNAVILDVSNALQCQCLEGFTGNGSFCIDIDECTHHSRVCHSAADCNNFQGYYECVCRKGFEGNGKICYPALPRPIDVTVTALNNTAVLITWVMQTVAELKDCILIFKEAGPSFSWKEKLVTLRHGNLTVLAGLKPTTAYLLKLILVSKRNSRSPISEIVEFKTRGEESEGGKVQGKPADRSGSSTAVAASVATVGTLVAIVIIAVVVHFVRRNRQDKQRASSMARNTEIPLSELGGQADQSIASAYSNPIISHTEPVIIDKWEVPRDKIVLGEKLGEGEFGIVLEGKLLTGGSPRRVAIKMLKDYSDRFDYKDMLKELDMFKGIGQHENVVSLLGACTAGAPLYIITEYISGGTLLELLRECRCTKTAYVNVKLISKLTGKDLVKLALDVARGMRHIAKSRFVHRDLAARNVLLTENMTAKITDFGLARDIYSEGIYLNAKGGRLPLKWMSPESLLDYIYTTHSDVWSYGVLMWEIWSFGAMPYHAILGHELLSKLMDGYRLEKPPHCPNEVYDVMRSCWNEEPGLRPTFAKLYTILEDMLQDTPQPHLQEIPAAGVHMPVNYLPEVSDCIT